MPGKDDLPQEKTALNELYESTIDEHQAYLEKLETSFNGRCEDIRKKSHEKLAAIPETDEPARQKVVEEEQKELDGVLAELKEAIAKSDRDARARLEAIENRLESGAENLEKALAEIN